MKIFSVLISSALFFGIFQILPAAPKKNIFDETAISNSLSADPDSEAKSLTTAALDDYVAGKFDEAAQKHFASLFFKSLSADAKNLPQELKTWFLSNPDMLEEFYSSLSSKDKQDKVFEIIKQIWDYDSDRFKKYPKLAFAVSFVYDVPPPQNWPHAQVSEKYLSRKQQDCVSVFKTLADMREKGKCLIQTERLSSSELRFLVASPASDEDREWAQKSVQVNLSNLDKLYSSIVYDSSRLSRKAFSWEYDDYALKTIKSKGGICVDQAYYTTEVAKARGVPAFIFSGAGAEGFHAWAACMTKVGNWNFDIGRYEGARFVTGSVIDPQTWETASDHSLESMREGFRNGQKYSLNQLHTIFAKKYFDSEKFADAEACARKAVSADPRNAETWRILIDCAVAEKDAKKIRSVYEAALKSFSRYPDSDAEFRREYIRWLLKIGASAEAQKVSSSIIVKTKSSRPDIAMFFAREELIGDISGGDAVKLLSSYKRLLASFKGDGAMTFNGICIPVINALLKENKIDESNEIMKITRQVLRASKDESLEASLKSVESQLAAFKENSAKKN